MKKGWSVNKIMLITVWKNDRLYVIIELLSMNNIEISENGEMIIRNGN